MDSGRLRIHKIVFLVVPLVLATVLAVGCRPSTVPVEVAGTAAPAVTPTPRSAWDELVRAAQAEGAVNVYATAIAAVREPLREAFMQRFGIDLQFVQGLPPEVLGKILAERRAGLYLADVSLIGDTFSLMNVKPLGITVPLTDLLVSPEVTNPGNWIRGRLPFVDEDHHIFLFMAYASNPLWINTDMVKEGEIASILDLLKPQWKGKIILSDPTVAGATGPAFAYLVVFLGEERGLEILRQLAAQEPVISRDSRLMVEWLAKGKYPVGYGLSQPLYGDFRRAHAPIKIVPVKEPRGLAGGPANLMVLSKNPHPKATQLFVNWLLGKEASTIWSKAIGVPSNRVDVNKDHVEPVFLPRDDDISPGNLKTEQLKAEMISSIAPKIFGSLVK